MTRAIITGVILLQLTGVALAADTARVIVKENAIREQCRFFSPVKTKIRLNDRLTVTAKSGDWYKVTFKGVSGCVHKSAVEQKSFKLGSIMGSGKTASQDEVSLAGKGFNPQVEASYKGSHPEADFHTVDTIEGFKVSGDSLDEFLRNGGLNAQ
ncbi:SH3 domain-containing protein [Geotalea sp. SG265]|uniref:SH3 domain-containing protein n=1 Tax=Geotalea sp. SG265 TaxID=2922867 RepID=UPI001FB038CC|nr:SH3 domain-containing protein [Geotalea sp. SG265]